MGEAKRRRLREAEQKDQRDALAEAVERVGAALRKLATAASGNIGRDCYLHAVLGQKLMAELGFKGYVAVGYAAWRVGSGDGDVISHTPHTVGHVPAGMKGFAYHAWLTYEDFIIDLTTYQLEVKARELDAADGGHTTVAWCPPALLLPKRAVRTYQQVAKAPDAGVAHYHAEPALGLKMMEGFKLDLDALAAARLILANPSMQVMGPNDVSTAQ